MGNCRPVGRRAPAGLILSILLLAAAAAQAGPPRPASEQQIKEMIAAAGSAEDYKGADLLYVLDEADVYVRSSGVATTEACQVIKVLSDSGVKSQSVQQLEFDPATNRIQVESIRIHRKDGGIDEVDVSKLVTQPAKQWSIYWGNQQHVFSLPRLYVGDTVEMRTSKTGYNIAYLSEAGASAGGSGRSGASADPAEGLTPPMPGHWFEVTLFQSRYPVLKKRYSVHLPADMPVQYEVYNGPLRNSLWFDGENHVYTWTAEDIPAVKREPYMVALDDAVPKVVMATVPDWEMKSRWFYEVNESQFAADDEIRAKVREIVEGLETDIEKIAALQNWVADNIRYYGTSRGPCEGFTIHASTETFRDRGGVCKDKAGMLVTMLREAGFEAYAALTMAGSRVEAIPADQFNHTVTVVRNKDGSFMILDPTWVPLSRELWSSREAEQHLVYGTPEGQPLTTAPYYEPEYNRLVANAASQIREDGSLVSRIQMDMHGYVCTSLRRSVDRHPPQEQQAAFEKALNIAPNARIEQLEFTDPYDYSRDGHVDMTISAGGYAAGGNGKMLFRMPLLRHPLSDFFTSDLFYDLEKEEREFGLRMRATRLVRYDEDIALPAGWQAVRVPEAFSMDTPAVSVDFSATPSEGALKVHFELALKKHLIPPEEYAGVRKALKKMKELSDEWVVCSTAEAKADLAAHAAPAGEGKAVRHE